jgi:tripeptidyl-peptidase-1
VVSSRDEMVTPSDLRSLYKTTSYVPAAVSQNVLGIGGFLGVNPSPNDLIIFMNEYRTDGADATYSVIGLNGGGYNPNNPGLEASNNLQYAAAVAYPTLLILYSTRGTPDTFDKDDMYLNWLSYLLVRPRVPQRPNCLLDVRHLRV